MVAHGSRHPALSIFYSELWDFGGLVAHRHISYVSYADRATGRPGRRPGGRRARGPRRLQQLQDFQQTTIVPGLNIVQNLQKVSELSFQQSRGRPFIRKRGQAKDAKVPKHTPRMCPTLAKQIWNVRQNGTQRHPKVAKNAVLLQLGGPSSKIY